MIGFKAFAIFALTIVMVYTASTCGGNCPTANCPTCYCGTNKNVVDIATWCGKHTWNQDCCKCIASHLSAGNANLITH